MGKTIELGIVHLPLKLIPGYYAVKQARPLLRLFWRHYAVIQESFKNRIRFKNALPEVNGEGINGKGPINA